jgi:hypothetical protein
MGIRQSIFSGRLCGAQGHVRPVAGLRNLTDQSDNQANVKQQLFSDWLPTYLEALLKRFHANGSSCKWHCRWDLPLNESD